MGASIDSAILITIDSLRYDRLGITHGASDCSPVLDAMARAGQWYTRAYCNSWYTQFSFPSIMSSTMPLDFGGYDRGVALRPRTLAEALRACGVRTAAFSTDAYLNAYYGYDRGFDTFHELFDVALLWQHVCRDYFGHDLARLNAGTLTRAQLYERAEPILARLLSYMLANAHRRETMHHGYHALHTMLFRHDPATRIAHFAREQARFVSAPRAYIDTLLTMPDVSPTTSASFPSALPPRRWRDRLTSALGGYPAKQSLSMVDAHDVVSMATEWIAQQGSAPSFAWLSLNDVHDLNFTHRTISPDTWRFRWRARGEGNDERFKHDLSLRFVDRAIGRLMASLARMRRLQSTLIVICADHGRTDDKTPFTGMFSDAVMRVPLIVSNPQLPSLTSAHPCALLDIAPTILAHLGHESEASFQGLPLHSTAARDRPHVVIEQLGGGPCDLYERQPLICLVGRDYKYVRSPDGRAWNNDLSATPRRGFEPVSTRNEPTNLTALRAVAEARYAKILTGTEGLANANSNARQRQ